MAAIGWASAGLAFKALPVGEALPKQASIPRICKRVQYGCDADPGSMAGLISPTLPPVLAHGIHVSEEVQCFLGPCSLTLVATDEWRDLLSSCTLQKAHSNILNSGDF